MNRATQAFYYGPYGGRFVPEMFGPALRELDAAWRKYRKDPVFRKDLNNLLHNYAGRPTPLLKADRFAELIGCNNVFLKLEGLAHTGAHKINNALGQALLAKMMGKTRIVAETGAGQHGVASAAAAARLGLHCTVFMGEVDMRRQYPNVYNMRRMGAEVIAVQEGSRTLKDAVSAALKYWAGNLQDTHYLLGSALGPHPYPRIVRELQSVIGREVRRQLGVYGFSAPQLLLACVGGGSNALGLFSPFLPDPDVRCVGVEAGGSGPEQGRNAIRFGGNGRTGIAQGFKSVFLQDQYGNLAATHSVSAGLDYAGVSPELAWLKERGRVQFCSADDRSALAAYDTLSRSEGIIPALESSHAVAAALAMAGTLHPDTVMVINISGRGDKDIFITAPHFEEKAWKDYLLSEAAREGRNE
ncbi:MAG: tryptophan synthase subunit beta [Spirochaetes bacterium]|nr:tryptophan synthase subunit beta [Spirochaetota bacterium]